VNWVELASALGALIGSAFAAYRANGNSRKIDAANGKIDTVDAKVNGNLTNVLSRLDRAQGRSAQLAQSISDRGGVVPPEKTLDAGREK
jgi:hypothetical protein